MTFDLDGTFGDDYLYFYEESIDDAHSDADTAEILGPARPAVRLPHPGRALRPRPYRPPAGRGRYGGDGCRPHTGLPGAARADPTCARGRVTYLEGDIRPFLSTGRSTRSSAG